MFSCPNIRKQLDTAEVEGAAEELHNECEMIAETKGKIKWKGMAAA